MTPPQIILPNTAILAKSPSDALAEIKNTLSATVNSIQTSLAPPTGPALPKIEAVFKGPKEFLASLTRGGSSSSSSNPGNPGNPVVVTPSPPGGVPGVTEEVISRRGM